MLTHLFSTKFIVLYTYILSAVYIHLRGEVRFSFLRQLTDHSTLMAPINAFIYLFSAIPNKPYIESAQFPELRLLNDNWQTIRDEALALMDQNHIKAAARYNDIGFNSFFRRGWKRFYLKWYENPLPSAQTLCPYTVSLLQQIPSINAAMFALLPAGSDLVRHRDPYAGSLRYHLGLVTPNSETCRIYVDGQPYHWKDGEAVMFDETYIHYAINESQFDRIILFCDVNRPLRNRLASLINKLFSKYVMAATATQNLETDRIGGINKAFKYLYAIRLVGKRLKQYNKTLYYTIKYALFLAIFALLFIAL